MTPDNRGDPAAPRFRFTNHHDIEPIPETSNIGTVIEPSARFHPRTGIGEVPMLQVHGFEINVYEDNSSLVVSIDSQAADSMCHDDGTPDLMVIVNEARIYDDTTQARTGGTAFTAFVTDAAPEH
jgi:hypothetical protein